MHQKCGNICADVVNAMATKNRQPPENSAPTDKKKKKKKQKEKNECTRAKRKSEHKIGNNY